MPDTETCTEHPGSCVFCEIVAGRAHATIVRRWDGVVAILPLNPVAEGHTLVVPAAHVDDVSQNPAVSALTMAAAAEYTADVGPCNIITSAGAAATQTVFHLHLHVIPRRPGDGLALPWTPERSEIASQVGAVIGDYDWLCEQGLDLTSTPGAVLAAVARFISGGARV